MHSSSPGLCLALGLIATLGTAFAQDADGGAAIRSTDSRILLRYATFDPLVSIPEVPPTLRAGADVHLWIVQFQSTPNDGDRQALHGAGGVIRGYLPNDSYVVRIDGGSETLSHLPRVRWVGPYHPAYRLEGFLVTEHVAGAQVPDRRYNMVMADKRGDKQLLEAKITAMGGRVFDRHIQGLLFTADLTAAQLLAAARLDEVLWIDRWTEPGIDMNNARIQGGANYVESVGGYTGSGIRGHIYEGCEATHPDFTPAMTNVLSGGQAQRHGHCTTGIVFADGFASPNARGMAPDAVGYYTNYSTVTAGNSRNMVIDNVVNVRNCMFTTASWGGGQTPMYTSVSADADDIVFDHRIPWTQSMSNLGNTNARPEAWGKNIISVGGVEHFDNSNPADDSWLAGNGSTGPAQDGRIKPDLCAYYDSVWTSDLSSGVNNGEGTSSTGGYNTAADPAGQSFTGFSGTSSATPIVAGHNAIAIQMYTDNLFNNAPRVEGGTRFQNRPYAQTLKALQICGANMYTPTATNNRREHVGWGFPNLANLWNRRDRFMVIPEDVPITQGSTHTYSIQVIPGETLLKVCMTYVDPAGVVAAAIDRINDLTLRVTSPSGTQYWGNNGLYGAGQTNFSTSGGSANTVDTVECVMLQNPAAGVWTIQITAPVIAQDAHLATATVDATYALVVNGGTRIFGSGCARYVPDFSTTGVGNYFPWGGYAASSLTTLYASNNGGSVGGAVYFDVTPTTPLYIDALDINTSATVGDEVRLDVYRTAAGGTSGGNEANPAAWIPLTAGKGTSAGTDVASHVDLSTPFLLSASSYGIAIVANNFSHRYTNGNGLNQNYSNTTIAIATGTASNAPFTAPIISPRVANVALYYRTDASQGTNIRYQTVLRHGELGGAGAITGLAFSGQSTGRHYNSSLLVRMSNVAAGYTLVSTFATNLPSPVTVLNQSNHSFEYVADQWREIGLQAPFAYNGVGDVVIDIVARGNWQTTTSLFNGGDEPRVYNAVWSGATPTTGTVDNNQALRMRVSFNCATANEHGSSCGTLEASHTGDGHRNATFHFRVNNAPPNLFAFISLGLNNNSPYPISTNFLGWTNCFAWHSADTILTVPTNASGVGDYALVVPNTTANDGLKIFGTWFALDTSEPGSLTFSNYTRVIIGLTP